MTTHAQLVARAAQWLRNTVGCSVVNTRAFTMTDEQPDAIGWKAAGESWVVECKVSRADFLRDLKKPWRTHPFLGMGTRRVYFAEPGVIKPEELPDGWGLALCHPRTVTMARAGCTFPEKNVRQELLLALSIVRRLEAKEPADAPATLDAPRPPLVAPPA